MSEEVSFAVSPALMQNPSWADSVLTATLGYVERPQ